MPDIPTREPDSIQAGDTLTWKRSLSDYPASSWVLSYRLTSTTAQLATIAASADGDDHLVSVAPATTAAWAAGDYELRGQAYNATTGAKHTVFVADVKILADLMAENASGNDQRSHAVKTLAAIEATILTLAGGTNATISVDGETYSRKNLEELERVRGRYRTEVAAEEELERINRGLKSSRVYKTRF